MPLENEPVPISSEPSPAYVTTAVADTPGAIIRTAIFPTATYYNSDSSYYATTGSGGGSVNQVTAGAGMVVSPTTGNVVVSMPSIGTAGTVTNPGSITTDAQGRVTAATPLGYVPVNPTALSAYAPLAGATFTGAVSGIEPTTNANLATKLYVDNAVSGGGGGVFLPLAGGTMTGDINLNGNELTNVSKISNATGDLDIQGDDVNIRQLSAGTEEAPNILNITSAGATVIASGGAVTCTAIGAVNMTAGLSASLYAQAGSVSIGGLINHITVEADGTTVSGVSDLIASGEISAASVGVTNGMTASGNVNFSGATTVTVPTPTLAGQAANKGYVDSVVGGGGAGLATVNTFTNTNNFTGTNSDFTIGTSGVPTNGVSVFSDQIAMTAGATGINVQSLGSIQILNSSPVPNVISIGSLTDTVDITGNAITCGQINSGEIFPTSITASGVVSAATVNANFAGLQSITCSGTANFTGAINVPVVPALDGSAASKQYVDQKTGQPIITTYASQVTINTPQILNIPALSIVGSTLLNYKITGVYNKNGYVVSLPSLATNIPVGTCVIVQNDYASTSPLIVNQQLSELNTFTPISVAYGASVMFIMKFISTAPATLNSLLWTPVTPANSVPLTGTEENQPITGTITFEDGNGNIECADIATALLSAVAPYEFISVTDPMQTRELGVRSADGVEPATIRMALSESALPADVLSMLYNPTGDNALVVNKKIIADGVNLNDAIAFKDANEFFVSANGSDTTGNGSANAPFATITKAITVAEAALSSNIVVNVAAGEYNENLTISKGHIMIKGNLPSDRAIEGVILSGKITINITDVDNLFNNQVILAGFFLSGQIEDISTKKHTLIVSGMRIEADSALGGSALVVNSVSALDQRTIVQNCVITQEADMTSTAPLVAITVGWLNMSECDLSVRTTGSCIFIGNTALISRLFSTALDNSNTSSTATQLISISSTTTSVHNIAQSSFAFSSSTAKADAPAIRVSSAIPQTMIVAQNGFALQGTSVSSEVIKFSTASTVVVLPANNRSVPNTAAEMPAGGTIVPLTPVGEQFVNNIVAGDNVTVNFSVVNGVRTATISSSGGSGGVTSVNSATGAITIAAGSGIGVATVDGVVTISNTAPTDFVEAVVAGSGITIAGTATEPEVINDGVLTVNSAKGAITVAAGTNIGVATVDGVITISNTAPTDFVEAVVAGSGITIAGTATEPEVVNDGVLTVNSAKGAITVSAGTNIGVATVDGVITISNTAPTDFVESVSAGNGIGISGTASNPIINNTGVLSVTAGTGVSLGGSAAEPIINATGIQAVSAGTGLATTGGTSPTLSIANTAVTAGTYTYPSITVNAQGQITAASSLPAVSEVGAGDGISVATQGTGVVVTNTGVRSLTADTGIIVGGTANAPTVANDGVLTVNSFKGAVSLVAGTGIGLEADTGVITITNSSPNAGVQSLVAGTGIVVDATDPANPTVSNDGVLSINGANAQITISGGTNITVATTGNTVTVSAPNAAGVNDTVNSSACTLEGFVSNIAVNDPITASAPVNVFTYTEVLELPFWRYTNKVIGYLGYLTMALNKSEPLVWTATVSKNGSAHVPVIGTSYFTDSQYFSVPVNMISQIATLPDTFLEYSTGDTVEIKFFAQHLTANADPVVSIAPQALQAIYSPINGGNAALPSSGTLEVNSPVSTLQPLDPANNYRFSNGLGVEATLTTYVSNVPETPVTVAVGATYPAVEDPAITGRDGYTMVEATPSFPSSPITILSPTSEVPEGIDPQITYTFINNSGVDLNLQIYKPGFPPETLANPFLNGATVVAPASGYTGYTATL
jgi:hypothetical protein